jgi:hypothetical protein
MRPLEKLPTIRAKLGSVIVFAVAVTLIVSYVLIAFYLRNSPRIRRRSRRSGSPAGPPWERSITSPATP